MSPVSGKGKAEIVAAALTMEPGARSTYITNAGDGDSERLNAGYAGMLNRHVSIAPFGASPVQRADGR